MALRPGDMIADREPNQWVGALLSVEHLTDAEVIAASLDEPDMFVEVFHRHFAVVHRYVGSRAGTHAADDLAAETFTVAFASRRRFEPVGDSCRAWLLGIATNLLRRQWRSRLRRNRAWTRAGAQHADLETDDDVDVRIDATAQERRLSAALADLRRTERDVLLLYAWADLSYAEISSALGIPLGTVRSRLHRARRAVRAQLEDLEDTEPDSMALQRVEGRTP